MWFSKKKPTEVPKVNVRQGIMVTVMKSGRMIETVITGNNLYYPGDVYDVFRDRIAKYKKSTLFLAAKDIAVPTVDIKSIELKDVTNYYV